MPEPIDPVTQHSLTIDFLYTINLINMRMIAFLLEELGKANKEEGQTPAANDFLNEVLSSWKSKKEMHIDAIVKNHARFGEKAAQKLEERAYSLLDDLIERVKIDLFTGM
jgi:hypothetical protein